MRFQDDPRYWRGRAEEARAIAEQLEDPGAKAAMLQVADGYEKLAAGAAQRQAQRERRRHRDPS